MRTNPTGASRAARPARRWRWTLAAIQIAVCVGALAVHAQDAATSVDNDNGLPDARLGTPLKAFQGLQKTEDTGRWLSFTRPSDKLEYEGVPVAGITYNFFKDQLYSISLDVDGSGNVKRLLKVLLRKYGKEPSLQTQTVPKTNAELQIREWSGKRAYCLYKSASDFRGAVLILLDKPTWDALQIPKREKENQSLKMLGGSYTNGDF